MAPICSACGAEVEAGIAECPECGTRLSEPTAAFDPVEVEAPEAKMPPVTEGPVLVVRKGPQPGEKFFIERDNLTVGRDPASDIFLNDMTVSRTHATVESANGVVSVKDAGSLNGTYLNGEVVESATLDDGDILQIGTFQMVFLIGPGAE
jgi:hypothetical protein